jgi:uncharacterized membrane protein YhdT
MWRFRMAWAVSGQAVTPDGLSGCLVGYLWFRLACFLLLLMLRPICSITLRLARCSGDEKFLADVQHAVAQLTPLLWGE